MAQFQNQLGDWQMKKRNRLVRLLRDIEAEGVKLEAGTVCEVERSYVDSLDLHEPKSGVLFWTFPEDVEEVDERKRQCRN